MSSNLKNPLVGIIANCVSLKNRLDLVKELGEPHNGFFNPLKFKFNDISGEIVSLDMQPNEMLEKSGFEKARQSMLRAVKYLVEQGVKIICFTASTKRLSGKFGQEVKSLYPDMIFTIGDNATMISFSALLNYFLFELDKENDVVACVGAGFLGEQAVGCFLNHGFKNIFLLSEQKINYLPAAVTIVNSFEKLPGNIKLLSACSHKYQLNPVSFANLFAKPAVIIDVCVPAMVNKATYKALPPLVQRFDAGDFYLPDIKYDFDDIVLNFPGPGYWYGCFTEAVILALALLDGHDLKIFNFFEVSQKNKTLIQSYLKKQLVSVPMVNFFSATKMYALPL